MTAKARIYRPDKNAMQSGKADMNHWVLEFAPDKPYFIEPVMGWNGMTDMTREIVLWFPTREAAIAYAEKNRIPYEAFAPNPRSQVKKAYADNFRYDKISG